MSADPVGLRQCSCAFGALSLALVVTSSSLAATDGVGVANRIFAATSEPALRALTTAVAVDPADTRRIVAASDRFIWLSTDSGETWRRTLSIARQARGSGIDRVDPRDSTAADATVVDTPVGDVDLPTGSLDALQGTLEAGRRTRLVFAGATERTLYVIAAGVIYRSYDGGETFVELALPDPSAFAKAVAIDEASPSRIVLATDRGLFLSASRGDRWTRVVGQVAQADCFDVAGGVVDEQWVIVVATDRGAFRSWNGGETFRALLIDGETATVDVGTVRFDSRTKTTIAAVGSSLFAGERRAAVLEKRAELIGAVTDIAVAPLTAGRIAVGSTGEGVRVFDHFGLTRISLDDRLPALSVLALSWGPTAESFWLATDRGLYALLSPMPVVEAPLPGVRQRMMLRHQPTLEQTLRLALMTAMPTTGAQDVDDERAVISALLPQLSVRYEYANGRPGDDLDGFILIDDQPDEFDEDSEKDLRDLRDTGQAVAAPVSGDRMALVATVTWSLDDVVWPWRQRRLNGLRRDRQALTARLRARVRSLHRERLYHLAALADDRAARHDRRRRLLRLAAVTAQLDAATGFRFVDLAQRNGALLPELRLLGGGIVDDKAGAAVKTRPRPSAFAPRQDERPAGTPNEIYAQMKDKEERWTPVYSVR